MTLMVISIVLLVIAGLVGAANFARRARGKTMSPAAGYAHGVLALAAFVLLIVFYSAAHLAKPPNLAYQLLALSLVAGFVFFGINLGTRKPPRWLALAHGVLALAGLVFLLLFVFAGIA